MSARTLLDWKPEHSLLFAQVACLTLGLTLLVWGFAPPIIERMFTGSAPAFDTVASGGVTFLIGSAFLFLHAAIRRACEWALWTAFLLAAALCGLGIAVSLSSGGAVNAFALLLSGLTTIATWAGLGAIGALGGPQMELDRPEPLDRPTPPGIDSPQISTPARFETIRLEIPPPSDETPASPRIPDASSPKAGLSPVALDVT